MASDRFEIDPMRPEEKSGSGCLKGCLIAVAIAVVLVVVVMFVVMKNWRGWIAGQMTVAVDAMVEASELPAQEQAEVKEQLTRVTDAFRENRISGDQVEQLLQQLVESPLIPSFMVGVADAKYLSKSGLAEEEKVEGRQSLGRFVRGLTNEQIDEQALDEVMVHVADRGPNGDWNLRDKVSDEDLRAFLAAIKTKADEAEIPLEVEAVDPSEEFRRIIDDVLGEAAAQPVEPG